MKIDIKTPSDCNYYEITLFLNLVKEGSQVNEIGLRKRILGSKLLGFCYFDNELVGVSTIKNPIISYRNRTFKRGNIEGDATKFKYELGYSVTKKGYQGKGINYKLNNKLISNICDGNIYATTGNPRMVYLLEKLDFKPIGEKYKGEYNDELQIYSFMGIM